MKTYLSSVLRLCSSSLLRPMSRFLKIWRPFKLTSYLTLKIQPSQWSWRLRRIRIKKSRKRHLSRKKQDLNPLCRGWIESWRPLVIRFRQACLPHRKGKLGNLLFQTIRHLLTTWLRDKRLWWLNICLTWFSIAVTKILIRTSRHTWKAVRYTMIPHRKAIQL